MSTLTTEYGEAQRLEKETRNWARKVAKETRSLADLHDKINQITNRVGSCLHVLVLYYCSLEDYRAF